MLSLGLCVSCLTLLRFSLKSYTIDVVHEAFERAKALFSAELTHDECKRIWIGVEGQHNSMRDVQDALMNAKRAYDSKPRSKARKWLAIFSSRLIYYGNVLDVLSQHHPAYVSLAWGAFKFLFVVRLPKIPSTHLKYIEKGLRQIQSL